MDCWWWGKFIQMNAGIRPVFVFWYTSTHFPPFCLICSFYFKIVCCPNQKIPLKTYSVTKKMLCLRSSGWFAVKKTRKHSLKLTAKTPIENQKNCWLRWWNIFRFSPIPFFAPFHDDGPTSSQIQHLSHEKIGPFPPWNRLLRDGIWEGHATSSLLPILIGALTHRLARFKKGGNGGGCSIYRSMEMNVGSCHHVCTCVCKYIYI